MDEESLTERVKQAQQGDRNAWGEVYRELAPLVFRLCRRILPTREDAEDATADIFLKVQVRFEQYDSARPFKAWLYRVAGNHCWDILRKRRGKSDLETLPIDEGSLENAEPDPCEQMLEQQTKQEVRNAVAQLSDRARTVVAMRFFAELSYEEIAETLGMTPSLVGVTLLRARRHLRRLMMETEQS
jgi:RNA polymerase sigma-70 factor (ECF subfamily)